MNSETGNFILLPEYYLAEYEAARFITKLSKAGCDKIPAITDGLKYLQPKAVENACTHSVSILTGPPGTGKTTTLCKIVDSYLAAGLSGIVLTPTGKAAKRASEVINAGRSFVSKIECSTIQSGLVYDFKVGGYTFNRENKFPHDFIIFDEFSMPDVVALRDAVEAIKPGSRIVFSGDQYQIPSVGPGNVARDLIESECIPFVELDTVLRTGPNSGITFNANRILHGQEVCKADNEGQLFTDFYLVPREDEGATLETIVDWVTRTIPAKKGFDPLKDIQLMSAAKNSLIGTKNINDRLRDMLNPDKGQKSYNGIRVGDKVINNKNDKSIAVVNGDCGIVKDILVTKTGATVEVDFGIGAGLDGGGIVQMNAEQFGRVSSAYCFTIHKSQGSEFPVAIIPIHRCHTFTLNRQLVYTGLTRARQLGILIGDNKALNAAISNVGSLKRKTALKGFLKSQHKQQAA